jgi:hypothetical protein
VAAGDSVQFFLRILTPTDTPSILEHASTITLMAE